MTEMRGTPKTDSNKRFPAPRPRIGSNKSISRDSMQDCNDTSSKNDTILDNSNKAKDFENEDRVDKTDIKINDNKNGPDEESGTGTDNDSSEEEDATDISEELKSDQIQTISNKSDDNSKMFQNVALIIVAIIGCIFVGASSVFKTDTQMVEFNTIKEQFPAQSEDLWLALESGVQDVVKLERPSTFILLYKEEAEDTLSNILEKFSQYAVCCITECSHEPITVTDSQLNSPEILSDYGVVIKRYRTALQEKGVMIVKNLENVRGVSAQAFHSFCDEYQPLVEKSLIIFTMKVDELQGRNNMQFVEEYLRNTWTDIKTSALNALITRITSMVLEVVP